MLISLSDLRGWRARSSDGSFAISDLFFDPDRRKLAYLSVADGSTAGHEGHALVAASLLGDLDSDKREIALALDTHDLARAPHWDGGRSDPEAMLLSLPPLMAGPFGATHAPLPSTLPGDGDQDAHQEDPRAEEACESFERLGAWLGRPVFASDGEAGIVGDLLLDYEENRLAYIVVDNDRFFHNKRRAVPFTEYGHRAPQEHGGHVVLTLPLAELERSPDVADIEIRSA